MIYMRQKINKNKSKQQKGNEISNNSVMNMLKNKINKTKNAKVNIENIVKDDFPSKKQQILMNQNNNMNNNGKKFYVISKSKGGDYSESQSKISQSIIVHDIQKYKMDPHFNHRHHYFKLQKCYDFKINNELKNNHVKDTYISMLQKQKDQLKQQLKECKQYKCFYNQYMSKCINNNDEQEKRNIQNQINSFKKQFKKVQQKLNLYQSVFTTSKQIMLFTAIQLLQIKNQLDKDLTQQIKKQKKKNIDICVQKVEKMISLLSDKLKDREQYQGTQTLEELLCTIKFQQKIINLYKQNQKHNKVLQLQIENDLFRHQKDRLTKHNQNLLYLLNTQQKAIQQDLQRYHQQNIKKQQIKVHIISHTSRINQCQTSGTLLITQRQQLQTARLKLQQEIKKNKKDYELQKQFLISECQSKQKEIDHLNIQISNLKKQVDSLQIIKQKCRAIQDSNYVLKHKIQYLTKDNEVQSVKIQYMTKDNENQSITIQRILSFLNKPQLKRYHRALIELINHYQQKISQLTQSYLQQKQKKDHLNSYRKTLYNIIKSKFQEDSFQNEELMKCCSQFDTIISSYKENRVDVYLRQIKGYTIGIDNQSRENIQAQLTDYIDQLRSRMPALTEEYLDQDGSSVANNSIYQFD